MDRHTTRRAGEIFALANAYHSSFGADAGQPDVCDAAASWAATELAKLGLEPGDLLTVEDCINAACGE